MRIFYGHTCKKDKAVDMNQSEICTGDGQTIPVVDEKVEFNLDKHRMGDRSMASVNLTQAMV